MNDTHMLLALLNNVPVNVYWKDLAGRYLWCNLAQARFFRLSAPEELVGKTDAELFYDPDLASEWFKNDQIVIREGVPIVFEETAFFDHKKMVGLSCKIPYKDTNNQVIGVMGITVDISEQKNREAALEKEKQHAQDMLQSIVSQLPEHVYWMDKNNRLLGCNVLQARNAGFNDPSEMIGKTNEDMPWANIADVVNAVNHKVMETGQEYTEEQEAELADGSKRTFFSRKVPLLDAKGHTMGMLGISFDITDRKKMEQDLLAAKNAAEAASRAKTEFLANMSHDMKTPLSGIVTTAEVIAYDQESRERDRQFASIISASGKQLETFFTSCLNLSKLEMEDWSSKSSVFSIVELVNDIHALYLPKAMEHKLQLSIECASDLPPSVEGHYDALYRTLLNLTGNAIKFTKAGSVTIRAFCSAGPDDQHTMIHLQVQDTGMGIPDDKFKVIFEKLQRLTPAYSSNIEGSGIGLYIVDQFVKRMGGRIEVESQVGKGSTFTVSVPLRLSEGVATSSPASLKPTPKTTETPMVVPRISPEASNSDQRVLLVEDVPIIQLATSSLLQGLGFSVDVAASGKEAIERCAANTYGVIYMDIGLPDMQGHEAAALIRQQEKAKGQAKTPIIALTGHGAVDVQTFCAHAGMQGVLSKPLKHEQAKTVWQCFVENQPVTVPGLTLLEHPSTKNSAIDVMATARILGSAETAQHMINAFLKELTERYIKEITTLVGKNDRLALRFVLHQLLGCLAYVISPSLQQAVLALQDAVRTEHESLDKLCKQFVQEANEVIQYHRNE